MLYERFSIISKHSSNELSVSSLRACLDSGCTVETTNSEGLILNEFARAYKRPRLSPKLQMRAEKEDALPEKKMITIRASHSSYLLRLKSAQSRSLSSPEAN